MGGKKEKKRRGREGNLRQKIELMIGLSREDNSRLKKGSQRGKGDRLISELWQADPNINKKEANRGQPGCVSGQFLQLPA